MYLTSQLSGYGRTQKARGIGTVYDYRSMIRMRVPPAVLLTRGDLADSDDAFERAVRHLTGDFDAQASIAFARPCPITPRHGFVDSRPVRKESELRAVMEQAFDADPEAEIIVMPFLRAVQSAIVTPTSASVGLGNDGATAGKAGTINLPLAHVSVFPDLTHELKGVPYFEIVRAPHPFSGAHMRPTLENFVVQMRDGPAAPVGSGDYIPADTTVREVLTADGDLLDWEQTVKRAKPGAVVWHPGGTALSHYAVHAVIAKLPVVFGKTAPQVGETLRANAEESPVDVEEFIRGCQHGLVAPLNGSKMARKACDLLLFGMHQSSALLRSPAGAFVVGMGIAMLCRLGAAACLGEVRHARSGRKPERSDVYTEALDSYTDARKSLRRAFNKFLRHPWPSGYGGRKWALCTQSTIMLDAAMRRVWLTGDARLIPEVMRAYNNAVHMAHNGGWWLNKFTTSESLDLHARGDLAVVTSALFTAHALIMDANTVSAQVKICPLVPVGVPSFKREIRVRKFADGQYRFQAGYSEANHHTWDVVLYPEEEKALEASIAKGREAAMWQSQYKGVRLSSRAVARLPRHLRDYIAALDAETKHETAELRRAA